MLNRIYSYLYEGLKLHETFGVDEVELLDLTIMASNTKPQGIKEADILANTIKYTLKFLEAKIEGLRRLATADGKNHKTYLDDVHYSVPEYITAYGAYTALCDGYLYYVGITSDDISKPAKDFFKEALPFTSGIDKKSILAFAEEVLVKYCGYNTKQPQYPVESDEYWKNALKGLREKLSNPEYDAKIFQAPKIIKAPSKASKLSDYNGMSAEEAVKLKIELYFPIEITDRCEVVGYGTLLGKFYLVAINADNSSAKVLAEGGSEIRDKFEQLVIRGPKGAYVNQQLLQAALDEIKTQPITVDRSIRFSDAGFAVNAIFSQMGTGNATADLSQNTNIATANVIEFLKDHAILDLGPTAYARDPRTGQLLKGENQFIVFVKGNTEGSFTNFDAASTAARSIIQERFKGTLLTGFDPFMIVGTTSGWYKIVDRDANEVVYCTNKLEDANKAATEFAGGLINKWISDKKDYLRSVSAARGMPDYAVDTAIQGVTAAYVSDQLPSDPSRKFLAVVNVALNAISNFSDL